MLKCKVCKKRKATEGSLLLPLCKRCFKEEFGDSDTRFRDFLNGNDLL